MFNTLKKNDNLPPDIVLSYNNLQVNVKKMVYDGITYINGSEQ